MALEPRTTSTTIKGEGPEPGAALLPTRLMSIDYKGRTRTITDLSKFEAANNPDGNTVYGVRDASPECLGQARSCKARVRFSRILIRVHLCGAG